MESKKKKKTNKPFIIGRKNWTKISAIEKSYAKK